MSDLFNYRNTNLIGSVIEGNVYTPTTGALSNTKICYVIDKTNMLLEGDAFATDVYLTLEVDPTITTYTTLTETNLILTTVVYIPACYITNIKEFPKKAPLVSLENGLVGATIKGRAYDAVTGGTLLDASGLMQEHTCIIVDKIKLRVAASLVENPQDIYIGLVYSGTTGTDVIYLLLNNITEVVSFGLIDYGKPSILRYTAINVVKDSTLTNIAFKDVTTTNILRTDPINTVEAVVNGSAIKIQEKGGDTVIINALDITTTYIDGVLVTTPVATAVTELNTYFANAGGLVGNLPVITSTSTILLTAGNNINHTVTGTNIVSVDFDISTTGTVPAGNITQTDFERRKIIGGSSLAAGTYSIIVTAYNYFGSTSQTLSLIVSASFANTYSFEAGSGVAAYNGGTINSVPMYRAADGTGASDAWSVMCWYKMKTANKYSFNYPWGFGYVYGGTGTGGVAFQHRYNTLKIYYGEHGTALFTLECTKPHGYDDWHCCLITYSGASTGTSLANAAAQFNMYIDGVAMTLTATQVTGTNGYTGGIAKSGNAHAVDMSVGGLCSVTGTVKNADTDPVDEVSCWNSELSSTDATTLYNSGTPLDLALFTPTYSNWWRNGDNGDIASFPTLNDMNSSGCDLTVSGGSVANYISDVP
tara:strand:- start:3838 stop:5778 length:1941 start_codon:yes stop_codon:yes gene_type:complete